MAANVEPGMWKEVTNFTWGIQNYSKPKPTELYSDTFLIMGYKWRFLLYPKGKERLAARLIYADSKVMPDEWNIPANIRLNLVNQLSDSSSCRLNIFKNLRNGTFFGGLMNFVLIDHLKEKGFLANDCLVIEFAVYVVERIENSLVSRLYTALEMLQTMIAKESSAVEHNFFWYGSVTLERICNRAPRTKTELLDMEGICKVNVTKYGDRLMQTIDVTIRNWCTEQGNGSNDKDASNYLSPKIQEVSKDSDDPEVIEPEVEDQFKVYSCSPQLSNKVDLSSPCSSNVQLTSKNLLAELSTMASDCKFTSVDATNDASDGSAILQQEREKLSKFFEMSVEEICQANWFDNVQEVVLKISELASDSYEKTVLKNLLSRLVEFRNRIPGSLSIIKSSNDAETSSEQTRKELEGSLFKRQKQLTFLDSEVSRIEEERMKVKAEIELLVALEHKLVHEKNSTEAEMEVANREVSIELGVLKRKRTQHKEALENLLRAKESLAQANTSWKLFKENLGL